MLLKGVAHERQHSFFNINEAKTIGIISEASNKEEFELVKKYVAYLRDLRKKVKVLGFFGEKIIPKLTYSKFEYDFFTLKDLNWHQKPSSPIIENFINEEFDILLDLNIYDKLPLKFIAAASKAKCKIGKYSEETENIYDLMIETDTEKSLKYFLRQIDIYLSKINKATENKV